MPRGPLALALAAATVAVVPGGGPLGAAQSGPAPLRTGPVDGPCAYSNTFGAARPGGRTHLGVDIIARAGVPLLAVDDGVISKVVPDAPANTGGNYLRLKIADGTYYSYLHLQSFATGIAVGTRVQTGQVIGYVGMTGSAPIPHLHFEVHPGGGDAVDPTPYVIAVGSCGPPSDAGVRRPPPPPSVTTTPAVALAPATREGVFSTVVPATVAAPQGVTPAVAPTVPTTVAPVTTGSTRGSPSGSGIVVFDSANRIPAGHATGVTVVGFPGLSATARSVTLAITITGDADGRAAVWPCGQQAGLDGGTPLQGTVAATPVVSTVTIAPGTQGRICLVATTAFQLRVAVLSVS